MGPIHCFETSILDYQSTLRKIPEERRCHLHQGGSLKSCGFDQDVKYEIEFTLQSIKPANTHTHTHTNKQTHTPDRGNYQLQIQDTLKSCFLKLISLNADVALA